MRCSVPLGVGPPMAAPVTDRQKAVSDLGTTCDALFSVCLIEAKE